ncbi:MAG TPA: ribonuclease P protein component [Planctomycetota bacterium]|nr:ribonuclease P protein component [Planctomycetota bacterium]
MEPEAVQGTGAERAPRQRLPRALRIARQAHFQRAYRDGSRAKGSILTVVAVPNGLPHPRIGLSVGRSVWKSAVRRNRVRRIFREAFRLSRSELPAGFDLVLIPASPRLEPELAATREELVRLARKAAARAADRASRRAEGDQKERSTSPGSQ